MEKQFGKSTHIKSYYEPFHDNKNDFRMGVVYGTPLGELSSGYRKRKRMLRFMTGFSGLGALLLGIMMFAETIFS